MELKRVVVTGLGALTPIGNNVDELWRSLVAGVSGGGPITRFDAAKFKCRIAAELKGFDALEHFDRKEMRLLDGYTVYGLVVVDEALRFLHAVVDDAARPFHAVLVCHDASLSR